MNLPPIPKRMAKLERDPRGYPVPWNVMRDREGQPHFIVNDSRRHMTALFGDLCPICGHLSEDVKWFVGGPLSAFDPNGWYLDLPMHHECVAFAMQVCPWLALPRYLRRTDEIRTRYIEGRIAKDETQDPTRPAVFVAIASVRIKVKVNMEEQPRKAEFSLPHVKPIKPILGIEYWQHGKQLDAATGEALVRTIIGTDWRPPEIK